MVMVLSNKNVAWVNAMVLKLRYFGRRGARKVVVYCIPMIFYSIIVFDQGSSKMPQMLWAGILSLYW